MNNAANVSAGQLRWRYGVALSLIAMLTIFSQVAVQFLIADQKHDSRVMNIAGRQRMLSQKITKLGVFVSNAGSSAVAEQYRRGDTAMRLAPAGPGRRNVKP